MHTRIYCALTLLVFIELENRFKLTIHYPEHARALAELAWQRKMRFPIGEFPLSLLYVYTLYSIYTIRCTITPYCTHASRTHIYSGPEYQLWSARTKRERGGGGGGKTKNFKKLKLKRERKKARPWNPSWESARERYADDGILYVRCCRFALWLSDVKVACKNHRDVARVCVCGRTD